MDILEMRSKQSPTKLHIYNSSSPELLGTLHLKFNYAYVKAV